MLDDISTAAGIIEIVNVNMMGAVRVVTVERGEDPREYALAAFGGAGPLHAAEVAREIGIGTVIVPLRLRSSVRRWVTRCGPPR